MDIIEPSEILVGKDTKRAQEAVRLNPWMRFLARFFDYSLWCLLLKFSLPSLYPFPEALGWVPVEFLSWIPMEATFLVLLGTTPGKWFLRIRLAQGTKKRLDWATAFRRSFLVWFRGLGMGISWVLFFSLLIAYHRIRLLHYTSWDRELYISFTHRPIATWRFVVAIGVIAWGMYWARWV